MSVPDGVSLAMITRRAVGVTMTLSPVNGVERTPTPWALSMNTRSPLNHAGRDSRGQ
jgi:hypothetical protein